MDFIIRRAGPNDVIGLAKLYLEFWGPHKGVDPLIKLKDKLDLKTHVALAKREIRNRDVIVLIAVKGDEVVGYLEALIKKNESCMKVKRYGYFNSAVTHKRYRRQGIARALTEAMIKRLRAKGIRHIRANVYNSNKVALRTWQRLGLEPQSTNLFTKI